MKYTQPTKSIQDMKNIQHMKDIQPIQSTKLLKSVQPIKLIQQRKNIQPQKITSGFPAIKIMAIFFVETLLVEIFTCPAQKFDHISVI